MSERSGMDLDGMVADLSRLGPPFRVRGRGDDAAPGADQEVFEAARLADPADGEADRMVRRHAAARGMAVGRHVGSLVFQRYCHRVCGVAVAAWVRHDAILDLTAPNTAMVFVDGTPDVVQLHAVAGRPEATAEDVVETVVDGHLLLVARSVSAGTGPGLGNLWGNIAAGFAGAFRTLSRFHDAEMLRGRAEELAATHAELDRGGTYRSLSGPRGTRLHYDRRSCCHWYAAPDGKFCSWCCRLDAAERTARFRDSMAAE
ncbi:hypothetical protein [Gordonia sp. NPDC058843]|uniref:hypothetical protein n=1 Tax=Gordonia sp. NPDC058843 TaxID=3346648 RepID=UPI0036C8C95D